MRTGRPTPPMVLSAEERQTLEQWARRPTTAQGLAQRARLVLACATSKTNGEITTAAGVTRQTVGRWRHLCLPLIRPIGSRHPPDVFVMEPTDSRHIHHPALARRVHTPWLGRVLGQR